MEISNQAIINILKYLRDPENNNFTNKKVKAIIDDQKQISSDYYDRVIDQPTYHNQLKQLMKDWYTAHKSILTINKISSDPEIINHDLLLSSFGYPYSRYHSSQQKKKLSTIINDLYARKCSPSVLADILNTLNVEDIYIFEYWLHRKEDDSLVFKPQVVCRRGTIYIPDEFFNDTEVGFHEAIDNDPYWPADFDEFDIIDIDNESAFPLPSLSPFFGLGISHDLLKSKQSIIYINRVMRNEYNLWMYGDAHATTGNTEDPIDFNPDKPAQNETYGDPLVSTPVGSITRYIKIESYDNVVSMLELMIAITGLYYYVYGYNFTEFPSPNEIRHPESDLPDSIMNNIGLLKEKFDYVYQVPETREEREAQLLYESEHFIQNNNYTFVNLTPDDIIDPEDNIISLLLLRLNPTFYNYIKFYIEYDENQNLSENKYSEDCLYELVQTLDDYLVEKGFEPTNFIFNLKGQLMDKTHLKTVIDYFKPYYTRLLKTYYANIIKDVPGDVLRVGDKLLTQNSYKMYDYFLRYPKTDIVDDIEPNYKLELRDPLMITSYPALYMSDITVNNNAITISIWSDTNDGDEINIYYDNSVPLYNNVPLTTTPFTFVFNMTEQINTLNIRATNVGSNTICDGHISYTNVTEGNEIQEFHLEYNETDSSNIYYIP